MNPSSKKLELLVSELMAVDMAMQQAADQPTKWYSLMRRHQELRAAVLAMEEKEYPGGR